MSDLTERLAEALEAINHAWNTRDHGQDIHSFHFWYAAHIEMTEELIKEFQDARTS